MKALANQARKEMVNTKDIPYSPEAKAKYAPTDIVKALKGGSARLFFKAHPEIKKSRFWGGHLWSHSYFMSTLGSMSKDVVEKYIQNQYSK